MAAGAGVALVPRALWGQESGITIAGRPVQIAIASLSPSTVRVSVQPLMSGGAQPVVNKGALVEAASGRAAGSWRTTHTPVRAGELTVRFNPGVSPTIVIDTRQGERIQTLTFDAQRPSVNFSLGKGPLFGLGEGGPQFDRRGHTFGTRNGQGGYQLRTHGGRVPIQWLMSTDGWGMYIHQPLAHSI